MKYNEPYIKGVGGGGGGGGGALPNILSHNFINCYICVDLEKSLVLLFEVQAKDLHNFTFSLATRGLITTTRMFVMIPRSSSCNKQGNK